ncbi:MULTISPECIES: M3 family metallopeptidase [Acinetobacter]|uniref:M3 family metallopeptidase n=2 Tax=Gammaproteobacteria TaxID=1236 RepID=UPI0002DFF76F|nr:MULTISPECIES: M3 family metallopeptidase [Acinetobacter]KGH51001.1 Zn-dependent oligopeptidase [Acinetobacter idrijaensis]ODN55579.1 Zn-dependent oligopeptidase [Acinetobacter sp. 51m]AUC05879.1 Zn-dependent oligopeptidase [Acinetobacter lwoffii]MCU4438184.1 Zn-dependent oligopeptidase [Acinetobacter lwoffii]QGR75510.1 Zn-dependent oligopeptidase [Acinetobacter lwoffii]
MKSKSLKLSTLCLMMMGGYQGVAADTQVQLLPLFKAAEIPSLCDASLDSMQKDIQIFENKKIKNKAKAGPYLAEWDELHAKARDFGAAVGLYSNVDPDPALRQAADDCELKISKYQTTLYQNPKLYAQFKKLKASDPIDQKFLEDILEQFENTGVQLSAEKQKRLKEIIEESTKLGQDFSKNVRDNPEKVEFTPAEMKGLPESYIANLKKNEKGNYLLGFDYPEYQPFMELAESDEARKRYQTAYTRRGTEQNLQFMKKAIDLRYEMAQLFDKESYAHSALEFRMAKTPEAVNGFLDEVYAKVAPLEKQDVEQLRQFKAETLKVPLEKAEITRWNQGYWSEKLRQAKYKVDQEKLRDYFPTEASQKWLFSISSELYGIEFKPVKVKAWHDEVEYYAVHDKATGEFLGGLYVDKYPREGKYGHAAVWGAYGGSTLNQRRPVSVLVTNFNRKGLNSNELETFVHEMGHALHGILSKTRYTEQSGTSVERDFVEAPSQMYEEWARRLETLSKVADYCEPTCPRVDAAMTERLKNVKNYGRGLHYARQALYAQYDMALHGKDAKNIEPLKLWQDMEGKTALGYVSGQQFPGQFGHLMGGYQAGYYSYMWSEVIALDMLSSFGDQLMDKKVGAHYRNTVLAQGGQKHGEQMVKDFLGRDPDSKAFFNEISGKN